MPTHSRNKGIRSLCIYLSSFWIIHIYDGACSTNGGSVIQDQLWAKTSPYPVSPSVSLIAPLIQGKIQRQMYTCGTEILKGGRILDQPMTSVLKIVKERYCFSIGICPSVAMRPLLGHLFHGLLVWPVVCYGNISRYMITGT